MTMKKGFALFFGALLLTWGVSLGASLGSTHTTTTKKVISHETIYVRDEAPRFMSRKEIKADIPAWEKSANRDFRKFWHTPRVKIVLLGVHEHPKRGSVIAYIRNQGEVQGALAYHFQTRNAPYIVVYAGVGDYYGYSNSVSFTHELFELLADRNICTTIQGWPYPYIYSGYATLPQPPGAVWAQETADPVEAFAYHVRGGGGKRVSISDFVTPAWFNDRSGGTFDFMNITSQPFTIASGGYAQFWDGSKWTAVMNFRKGKRMGFYLGEFEVDGRG